MIETVTAYGGGWTYAGVTPCTIKVHYGAAKIKINKGWAGSSEGAMHMDRNDIPYTSPSVGENVWIKTDLTDNRTTLSRTQVDIDFHGDNPVIKSEITMASGVDNDDGLHGFLTGAFGSVSVTADCFRLFHEVTAGNPVTKFSDSSGRFNFSKVIEVKVGSSTYRMGRLDPDSIANEDIFFSMDLDLVADIDTAIVDGTPLSFSAKGV